MGLRREGKFGQIVLGLRHETGIKAALEVATATEEAQWQDLQKQRTAGNVDDWGDSAYTPEDLISNEMGADFGARVLYARQEELKKARWVVLSEQESMYRSSTVELIREYVNIPGFFHGFLLDAGAIRTDDSILEVLRAEASSWVGPNGQVLDEFRFRASEQSIEWQKTRPPHRCYCDGDVPKDEYRWRG